MAPIARRCVPFTPFDGELSRASVALVTMVVLTRRNRSSRRIGARSSGTLVAATERSRPLLSSQRTAGVPGLGASVSRSASLACSRRRITARIRHRHVGASATVSPIGADRATVTFDEPQLAITPGQAVVFYDGEEVLGGAWIERT